MAAVARDAGTRTAQRAFNDAGVDDAVRRDGEQDTGCPCGPFAEAFHVAALDELAQPRLRARAYPHARQGESATTWAGAPRYRVGSGTFHTLRPNVAA